jgi:hypothetical protein
LHIEWWVYYLQGICLKIFFDYPKPCPLLALGEVISLMGVGSHSGRDGISSVVIFESTVIY